LIAVGLLVVAYVLSFLIRLALSRQREFLADAGSVELTKNPDAMISALRKIEGRGELPGATSAVMEMCIDNPRKGFGELFDTHPSVAGGHDPGPLALSPPNDEDDDQSGDESPWEPAEQQTNSEAAAESNAGEARGPWSQPSAEPTPAPGPWGPHRS
jgi:heat shock protein HtpX